jgi:deoxyribodipyrimidine photo-lyase
LWLPELADLPADKVHQPELMTTMEQQSHQLFLEANYPKPMIDTEKWVKG